MTVFVNLFSVKCDLRYALSHIDGLKFFEHKRSLTHAMRHMFVVPYRDLTVLEFSLQGGILLSFCNAIFTKE